MKTLLLYCHSKCDGNNAILLCCNLNSIILIIVYNKKWFWVSNNGSPYKMIKNLTNQRGNISFLEQPDKLLAIINLETVIIFGNHLPSIFSSHSDFLRLL